jgi:hypothetical protein
MRRSSLPRRALVAALAVLAVAAAVLAGRMQAHAANTVITFDDLGIPAGGRTTVNVQYASQGVTFNDVTAIDYSQGFPAGFAHSGAVGIEQCFAVEFCTAPIAATFTTGQRTVKLWVGFSSPLGAPLVVRLTAFDVDHASLGSDEVTLLASPAVTPVDNPLEVTVPQTTIRSLEVSVPNGGLTNGVVVDDLEFSSAGPPPPCNATSVPAVHLTQPANSTTVQNNSFLLEGTVDTGGAPIESAQALAFGTTTRKASLYPTLIQSTGGHFGPVRFNGLLNQGGNKVIVTATNCLGTGQSDEAIVAWTPLAQNASFRMLGLEVSQAVQSASNSVPLIAATPTSSKRTFVRVYLSVDGVSQATGVSGRLTASRPDGLLPGGPATIPSLNTITVHEGATQATFDHARGSLANSLNFELPPEWLGPGELHLQLDHLEIEGQVSTLPCVDCDNPGGGLPGQLGPAVVRFHTAPPVRVQLVGVPYMSGTTLVSPRQKDFDMLASWLRRAYPSADIEVTQTSLATRASRPASCDDVNDLLRPLSTMAVDPRTRFYGLIPDDGGFVGGCSEIGGRVGSGPSGDVFPEDDPWDLDGSYADAYGGHEIAHMYGRRHPGFCANQAQADPSYPYPGGLLGTPIADFQGLDAGDATFSLPLALDDWRGNWHDVMTYCHNQWISDYTYRAIFRQLCVEDETNCPDHQTLFAARAVPAAGAPLGARGLAVSVEGSIRLSTGKVTLDPFWTRRGLVLTPDDPEGGYAVELRGLGGKLLAFHRFQPLEVSDPPSPAAATASIHVVVPFPAATRRIAITHEGTTLAAVNVSAHTPVVRLLSPNGGKLRGAHVTVRWTARDADRNRLRYAVLYSPDGAHYTPLASDLTRRSLRIDLGTLPGGSKARFQVLATDGVRAGSDRSDRPLRVEAKAPRVSIATPADGAELVAGQPVTLSGSASDLQDGTLGGTRLEWRSSLQGVLGTGASVTVTLQPGAHTLSLVATNSFGQTTVARIEVTVTAPPPVVEAVLVP